MDAHVRRFWFGTLRLSGWLFSMAAVAWMLILGSLGVDSVANGTEIDPTVWWIISGLTLVSGGLAALLLGAARRGRRRASASPGSMPASFMSSRPFRPWNVAAVVCSFWLVLITLLFTTCGVLGASAELGVLD